MAGVGIVGGLGGVGVVIWSCGDSPVIDDDWSVGLIVVPCNRL